MGGRAGKESTWFAIESTVDGDAAGASVMPLLAGAVLNVLAVKSLDNNIINWLAPREHSGNIQGTLTEHPGNIQGTSREHPGNIQGTSREHSGIIQGTFREHSGNVHTGGCIPTD
jgi:hypothetical protein